MKTGGALQLISFVFPFCLFAFSSLSSITTPPYLGIPPEDEKYFGSELIKCKEESKYFTLDRLNDDFCDCVDGTDEPGTSACPKSKFYCRNVGSTPKLLFSSRVNDHLCDCCDGSDEYDGSVNCPNTCFKGESVVSKNDNNNSKTTHLRNADLDKKTNPVNLEDLIQKIKDLRIIVVLEVVVVSSVIIYRLLRWRTRSRRRHYR